MDHFLPHGLVGVRRMRERLIEKRRILKRNTQPPRQFLQRFLTLGGQAVRRFHGANFFRTRQALCPPKPKLLEIAARTVCARA